MSSQSIMSLAVGRAAGIREGVSAERLGKLSIVSYMLANPILALVAARSMAPKDSDIVLELPAQPDPEPTGSTSDPVQEAKDAAGKAKMSEVKAGTSEANAKASEDLAKTYADAAAKSATDAKKSADDAKATK